MRRLILGLGGLALLASPCAEAGVIGKEDRQSLPDYAQSHSLDVDAAYRTFAASGRIMCNLSNASAFLVYRSDIVVTARHVLYPELDQGAYAGRLNVHRCGFETTDGKTSTWHYADVKTITYLPDKQRSHADRFDWVVMRLNQPIADVTPYRLPSVPPRFGEAVTDVTIRQDGFVKQDWNERVLADCKIGGLRVIDDIASAGVETDCSQGAGASGGAVLRKTAEGYEALAVISSATRRDCPRFDSDNCYSFAVGLTQPVIDAIKAVADR